MKLANMKLEPRKPEDEKAANTLISDQPAYPWGLQLRLDNEQLEKLGITALPAAGVTMTLTAKVEVTSAGMRDSQGGGEQKNLELQITDMALVGERTEHDVATKLYTAGKKSGE